VRRGLQRGTHQFVDEAVRERQRGDQDHDADRDAEDRDHALQATAPDVTPGEEDDERSHGSV
jgi:hypothetical protein